MNTMNNQHAKVRYSLIDALRGVSLVNMVLYHFLYDVFVIYGVNTRWIFEPPVVIWERYICFSFIIISGISMNFSSHAYRRGLVINACGLLLTLVTAVAIPSQVIWFGVLNLIGCAMLICQVLRKVLNRLNPMLGAALSFLLFALCYGVPEGYAGFFGLRLISLPDILYELKFTAFLGLPSKGFYSSDYFPLIPWLFLFLFGYFLWRAIAKYKWDRLFTVKIPLLGAIGRHTLWVYLAHQPLLMGLCFLIFGYF